MKLVNVLITAASRRVGLVRAFRRAVERFGKGRVITTDINSMSPALYFGHRNHIVPLTSDPEYIPIIESICDVENVHLIIPTIDVELPIFARNRARFEQNDVWVSVASEETTEISNDKYRMYEFALMNGIESPATRLAEDVDFEQIPYPVVVKPRSGRGSVQVFEAHNEEQLRFFCRYVPDAVVQDYLEGAEFTVDVCADFEGRVMSVVPRERLVIRAGVSDKGTTRKHKKVMEFATNVAESLGIVGAVNIQCNWDGHTVSLIEVNPRFSGGIPLTIASGADFATWLVQMRGGRSIPSQLGKFQKDLTMMSFEESLFASEEELKITRNRGPRGRFARTKSLTAFIN